MQLLQTQELLVVFGFLFFFFNKEPIYWSHMGAFITIIIIVILN